jgi:hypothetical protein
VTSPRRVNRFGRDLARGRSVFDQQNTVVRLFENDLTDDNMDLKVPGLLQSSRDAFQQAAAFNWGQAR